MAPRLHLLLLSVTLFPGMVLGVNACRGARRLVALKERGVVRVVARSTPVRARPGGGVRVVTFLPDRPGEWAAGVVTGDWVRREARRGAERALTALAAGAALALFLLSSFGRSGPGKSPGEGVNSRAL